MSRTSLGLALAATLALGGFAATPSQASAAPMLDPGVASASDLAGAKPDQVRLVCDAWGRCWRRPNYWAPRPYYGWGGGPYWGHRRHGWGHGGWGHGGWGHGGWGHRGW